MKHSFDLAGWAGLASSHLLPLSVGEAGNPSSFINLRYRKMSKRPESLVRVVGGRKERDNAQCV